MSRKICLCLFCIQDYYFLGVIVLLSQKLLCSIVLFQSWRAARGLFYYSGNSNYQLHFPLPAFFLSDTETSHSNVTMRVISFDLSHTLTAKPAARTLIQCTSCNGFPKTGSKQAGTMLSFLKKSKTFQIDYFTCCLRPTGPRRNQACPNSAPTYTFSQCKSWDNGVNSAMWSLNTAGALRQETIRTCSVSILLREKNSPHGLGNALLFILLSFVFPKVNT